MPKGYWVDENGKRIGESHQFAKLTDEEVERIRDMWDEGIYSYRYLAKLFNSKRSTISDICTYRRRAAYKAEYKTVRVRPKD